MNSFQGRKKTGWTLVRPACLAESMTDSSPFRQTKQGLASVNVTSQIRPFDVVMMMDLGCACGTSSHDIHVNLLDFRFGPIIAQRFQVVQPYSPKERMKACSWYSGGSKTGILDKPTENPGTAKRMILLTCAFVHAMMNLVLSIDLIYMNPEIW